MAEPKWTDFFKSGAWIGPAISGGLGLLGGFLGDKGEAPELQTFMPNVEFLTPPAPEYYKTPMYTAAPTFYQAPGPQWYGAPSPEAYAEFPEAEEARKTWMGRLAEWGREPGYGAIAPDWGDIWERAQRRVRQYVWGGPGGQPGIAGKVKASAARRRVAESPALETELSKLGMWETEKIGDIATEMATKEAEFGEAGRLNWLKQLGLLTGLRPRYYQPAGGWQEAITRWPEAYPGRWQPAYANVEQAMGSPYGGGPTTGELIGELGAAGGQAMMQYGQAKQQQDWYTNLMKQMGLIPGTTGSGAGAFSDLTTMPRTFQGGLGISPATVFPKTAGW